MTTLVIENLHVSYGPVQALRGISLRVEKGAIVSIIGANGAGKTTLLNTLSGLIKPQLGTILMHGNALPGRACNILRAGMAHVPEGRKIFAGFTIEENLKAGAYIVDDNATFEQRRDAMYTRFPILAQRSQQQAGTLSGGEQQMLAIARGLMSDPELLLLDEPSLGLAPLVVKSVFDLIGEIREKHGKTILLVEQNAQKALGLCDYAYVLENGKIVLEGNGKELLANPLVRKAYLGGE